MDNTIKVYSYIPASKAEKIANNKEFEDLYNKINLKYIGIADIDNEIYQVYYSFKTAKYYIVNPE